jgi:hypothetical protein
MTVGGQRWPFGIKDLTAFAISHISLLAAV